MSAQFPGLCRTSSRCVDQDLKYDMEVLAFLAVPSFAQHCSETTSALGKPFEEIHRWLDEFAGKPPYGMRHRRLRHHEAGVEEVRKRWGHEAAEAARLHIIADLKQE